MLIRALAAILFALSAAQAPAQSLDLVNATLIDGTGAKPRKGVTVAAGGVRRIDLGRRYLLPGLIDAHAHIESPAAALRALQSGVTTARVLGDTNFQAIGTRDLIRSGHAPGPEPLVSPGHIRPKPGVSFFMAYPEFGDAIDGELRGPMRIAAATRALIAKGADVIKVGASERAGLPGTDPRKPELTEDEMRAAVEEAARKGLHVVAHAHAREGVANAVRAGVRSIEHDTWVDDETLAEMKRRGTWFVPTLAVMSPFAEPRGHSDDDVVLQLRTPHMFAALKSAVRKAHALGIPIAASTDGSYDDRDDTGRVRVAHEIALYRELAGMSPLESVTAATQNGASILGIDARTGTVRVGLEADLVVYEGDPLAESDMLFEPRLVVSDGRILVEGYGL
jgi:imidazolonepropionase-like amidohydrolase